ncbi:MAG: M23 family metallopeptidase [Firmicutes bacterium]|nr:M23 family metallopeptidase [Bacillota bacterium]
MLKARYHKLRLRLSLWRCRIWNWFKIKVGSFRLTKRGLIGIYLSLVVLIGALFVYRFHSPPSPQVQNPLGDDDIIATAPSEMRERPEEQEQAGETNPEREATTQTNKSATNKEQEVTAPPNEEPVEPVVAVVVELEELHWPLATASIQNGYTLSAKSATLGDWRPHLAVDLAAERGAEVLAAAAGTVSKLVTNDPYWGTNITIDHGGGWSTTYSNIANPTVKVGDRVTAGQVIGQIEENPPVEMLDPLHLHFVLLHNGQPVDPNSKWQP